MWNNLTNIATKISKLLVKPAYAPELPVKTQIQRADQRNDTKPQLDYYAAREARGMANAKTPSNFVPKTVSYSGLDKLGHTTPFVQPKNTAPKIATVIAAPKQKMATPTPKQVDLKQWNNFAKLVIDEGNKRGYSGETLARQKALESGFGTSDFAVSRNNYGGIGAYDRNPNNAFSFTSPKEYLDYYFRMIEKRFPKAYAVRKDARKYVEELKNANYATDPDYVNKVLNTRVFK